MTTEVAYQKPPVAWWVVLIQGIAAIILGILLLMNPLSTTEVLVQFLGIYWLITGIISIVTIFVDPTMWGWKLFTGILGIIAGIVVFQHPLWSTFLVPLTLVILLGIIAILIGLLQLINAFRGGGWGMGVLGVLSIIVGFLLLVRPVIAGLALPFVFGILLIAGGILALFAAFSLKRVEGEYEAAQAREAQAREAARAAAAESASRAAFVPTSAPEPPPMAPAAPDAAAALGAAAAGAALAAEDLAQAPGEAPEPEEETGAAVEPVVESAESFVAQGVETVERAVSDLVDLSDALEMEKFSYPLEYVEGIGKAFAEKLKAIGLVTPLDLLKAGAALKGRTEIAEKSGISAKLILEWVNHVDLYRIKGVGSEYADLLEAAGVDTVVELAQRNPANLTERMTGVNLEKNLVRKLPTQEQVEDWVEQAKRLPRVITY
jgi:uncharacterized membrane protein HdeD (DUF308 family)/predicted flap endonuclease-1-like 5' DNA nuclease